MDISAADESSLDGINTKTSLDEDEIAKDKSQASHQEKSKGSKKRKFGIEEDQRHVLIKLADSDDIPDQIRSTIKEHTPRLTKRRKCVDKNEHFQAMLMINGNKSSSGMRKCIEDAKQAIEGKQRSEKRRKAFVWAKSF